jgi:hypothetical protein
MLLECRTNNLIIIKYERLAVPQAFFIAKTY